MSSSDNAKPNAPACERNRDSILAILGHYLKQPCDLLEIGSGTGQHAVYMGRHLPHLRWQTSDLVAQHAGIRAWLDEESLPNVMAPLNVDVSNEIWPVASVDAIYSANTLHIMSWSSVGALFAGIEKNLRDLGQCLIYGPFNYQGNFTGEGNRRFDANLRERDPNAGIRDVEAVTALATAHGLSLLEDHAMPADNRMLVWQKRPPEDVKPVQ